MPSDTTLPEIPSSLYMPPVRGDNTAKGEASKIQNARDARSLVTVALQEDMSRSYQRALVDGQYDGNSPYSVTKLTQSGNGWMCNINWRGLEGRIDGARIPYYGIFSGVPTYVTACAYEEGNPQAAVWESWYAKKWTEAVKKWRSWVWNWQDSQFEMLYGGFGCLIWEDDSSWKFRSVPARSVLVPQGSPSCLDKRIPWIAVRVAYRIHELFDKIRNEDAARKVGWNVEATQTAIRYGTRGQGGYPYRQQQWEEWQRKYKNRELEMSYTEADLIYCDHLYAMEYSGKVSHFIFTESSELLPKNYDEFLFKQTHRYDSYDQCIQVMFQNTGRGQWHSVQGMAVKAFKAEAVMDRLTGRTVDNAILSSGLILQTSDAKSQDRRQLAVMHGVTYIPPATTLIERSAAAGQFEGVLGVNRFIRNQTDQQLGNFQQRAIGRDDGRGEQPTATQVQFAATKEAFLSNGQVDNYYLDLDISESEVDRRLKKSTDPEAVWFREECFKVMPKEVFYKMTVRANRLSGYGSPAMREMAVQKTMPLVPMLNAEGKNNWLNEQIANLAGPEKVALWNPPVRMPDADFTLIATENVTFRAGAQVPVLGNNRDHMEGHLYDAEQYLLPAKQAEESGEPNAEAFQSALTYIGAAVPHMEGHMEMLHADPTEKANYELFKKQMRTLVTFSGKMYQAYRRALEEAEQQRMEQEQANTLGAMDQAKLQSMQAEMMREDAKASHDMALKTQKAQNQVALQRYKAGANVKLSAATTAADIQLKRVNAASERLNERNGQKSK